MNISFIILLLAFVILFAAYVRLARINKRRKRPYSWIRSDMFLPKTKRQVLLFIDADVPDGSRDTFRYRTAIIDEEDNGNKIFVVPMRNTSLTTSYGGETLHRQNEQSTTMKELIN